MEFRDYLVFLGELREELKALTAVEQRKIDAIRAGDLDVLTECMKQEQVATLSLRGKEQHRAEILQALGLQQVPLQKLPDHCPAQLRGETAQAVERLQQTYQVLASAQNTARTLMEKDLQHIEKQLDNHRQQEGRERPSQTDFRV